MRFRLKPKSDPMYYIAAKVKHIDYDFSRFTIDSFADWVANERGIKIYLESCDLILPLGFWFMSDNGAHVLYSARLEPALKIITVLHELMHIYLGHNTRYIPSGFVLTEYLQGAATREKDVEQSIDDQEAEIGAFLIYKQCIDSVVINPVSDAFDTESNL